MTDQYPRRKLVDSTGSYGVNAVINAANTNDRFKLLEDDTVFPANLKNPIHPLFYQLAGDRQLKLALRLASHFLLHDRTVEFFVPLLYGREMQDIRTTKSFLCDPLVYASKAKAAQHLAAVRQALQCLAKHVVISFVHPGQKQIYACTQAVDMAPSLTSRCCKVFQRRRSPTISMSDNFLQFYKDPHGYAQASRCAQFRHDFLFATTLVHEVVHAVGVMRRGNLVEPHYRIEHPETEWGYAWENFMFGSILNPQKRDSPGTYLLMRKVWADAKVAAENGGKEYCDVSMSWIAQWFRTETWNIVAERGPTAIALPTTHFKMRTDHKLGAWVVSSEDLAVRKDMEELNARWRRSKGAQDIIHWERRTAAELQTSNVPAPLRIRVALKPSAILKSVLPPDSRAGIKQPPSICGMPPPMTTPLVAAYRSSSTCAVKRKRQVQIDNDCEESSQDVKRSRL